MTSFSVADLFPQGLDFGNKSDVELVLNEVRTNHDCREAMSVVRLWSLPQSIAPPSPQIDARLSEVTPQASSLLNRELRAELRAAGLLIFGRCFEHDKSLDPLQQARRTHTCPPCACFLRASREGYVVGLSDAVLCPRLPVPAPPHPTVSQSAPPPARASYWRREPSRARPAQALSSYPTIKPSCSSRRMAGPPRPSLVRPVHIIAPRPSDREP